MYTPLHAAAGSGNSNCVNFLIKWGTWGYTTNIDEKNAYGNTPLHIACLNGHVNVVADLIVSGANIGMKFMIILEVVSS